MKTRLLFLFIALMCLGVMTASAQITSVGSGDWNTGATWSGGVVPTSTDIVTILSGHNVTVSANTTIGNVTVASGGTLTLTCSTTSTLTIASNSTLTVNGTFTVAGVPNAATPYNVVLTDGTSIITIASGGVVTINETTTAKGFLPVCTWQNGSTLNVLATPGSSWNSGSVQNFYNIIWNSSVAANFGWGMVGVTVGGNIEIDNTGGTGRFYFFGGTSGTVDIMGNLIVRNTSQVSSNGSGSANTYVVNCHGKVDVNVTAAGSFAISRGSMGGGGSVAFNFYDDVSIIGGTMNNSNATIDLTKFKFVKNGTQNLTLSPTTITGNGVPMEVEAGSNVNLTSPANVTTLYLNGGIITSSASNPLIMGFWTGSTLTSGTVSATAPGSSTSYVNGPMAYLVLNAATTSKTYPIGKGGVFRPVALSLTQSAATISTYTAEMFNAAPPTLPLPTVTLDKVAGTRYYNLSESSGGSAFTAGTLTLSYSSGDNVSDAPNLRIAQDDGANWVDLGGSGTASPTGSITSTNSFTVLGVFTLADNFGGGNALPVQLTSFTAAMQGTSAILNWATATEKNNAGFQIERSIAGSNVWAEVAFVNGHGTSSTPNSYSYEDKNLASGAYIYRIKQIDNDGTFKYYTANVDAGATHGFQLCSNYPNPFNPSTDIQFSVPQDGYASLKVYNMLGQEVQTLFSGNAIAGHYVKATFNGSRFASGIYFARLQYNGKSLVQRMLMTK
jgi:uncharacterized membrane protein